MCRGRKESREPKSQTKDNVIKHARNLLKLKKENEAIKDRIIRDIKELFGFEEYC